MQMYGPRQGQGQGSWTLPWAKCQIFLKTHFIYNNITTNPNKNFHTYLSHHSFKPLFLFLKISARTSLKKIQKRKMVQSKFPNKPTRTARRQNKENEE